MLSLSATDNVGSDALVVFMPGIGDYAEDIVAKGYFELFRQAGVKADLLAVSSHLGYFRERSVSDRLHEDIILPAKATGYKSIWLLGISLGGLGSILYDKDRPQNINGIIAIAPFLFKEEQLFLAVEKAGGLRQWQGAQIDEVDPDALNVWRHLKSYANSATSIPVYLLYGKQDKFARQHALLADALPDSRVYSKDGGHRTKVWQELLHELLQKQDITFTNN